MKIDTSVPDLTVLPSQRLRELPTRHRELIQAVRAVNASEELDNGNVLTFGFDRQTQRTIIKLVDPKTNALVEQIPAERLLRMAQDLKLLRR